MDKIDHKSKDILGGNVEKIAELFPGVITEAQDEATGEPKKAIDFDLLRQHLSDELVEGDRERFRLDWPGKKASILKANTPTTKTLRPVREDSVDFDTTQNVFIEGDNFEVLKVLQESYLGKIKMIYIDPPYNTGKDFIYRDNFAADREDYEEEIGVRDDENGGKLVKNTETNGRYHSDWLSMMQERLIVARDLMTDDGVIFISIDDNEQASLKRLCDEIFDEANFIETYIWNSTFRPDNSSKLKRENAQYILSYAKQLSSVEVLVGSAGGSSGLPSLTKNSMKESVLTFPAGVVKTTLEDGEYEKGVKDSGYELLDSVSVASGIILSEFRLKGRVIWGQDNLNSELKKGTEIIIKGKGFVPYTKKAESGTLAPTTIVPSDRVGDVLQGRAEVKNLFGSVVFDYPKPISLLKYLMSYFPEKDYIVLDFFAGSASTAHAAVQLNSEDGGDRKFVQVQLPEDLDEALSRAENSEKETLRNSIALLDTLKKPHNLTEISKERIRRAAKKIREDYAEQIAKREIPLDTGFRAYKLSSSNFVDTAQHPNETTQASLLDVTDNIKEGRTAEDLLTEVILDLGLTIDLPIEQRNIAGHSVFFVGGNSLVACFDGKVSLDIVDGIAAEKPLRVVFKDSSFANDETRINIDIRLKQLSPDTTVQVV